MQSSVELNLCVLQQREAIVIIFALDCVKTVCSVAFSYFEAPLVLLCDLNIDACIIAHAFSFCSQKIGGGTQLSFDQEHKQKIDLMIMIT